jgi:hypothetical protein
MDVQDGYPYVGNIGVGIDVDVDIGKCVGKCVGVSILFHVVHYAPSPAGLLYITMRTHTSCCAFYIVPPAPSNCYITMHTNKPKV